MAAHRVFVDTNVLLRYLTNDVPAQADAVEALLRRAGRDEVALVANALVIAELVWTLEFFYHVPRSNIKDKIIGIVATPGISVAEDDLVLSAIAAYAEKNVDFADAYNAAWLLDQGISTVCTFDRRHFSRLSGLEIQVPVTEP